MGKIIIQVSYIDANIRDSQGSTFFMDVNNHTHENLLKVQSIIDTGIVNMFSDDKEDIYLT